MTNHTDEEIRDANARIAELLTEAYKALEIAENIADEFDIEFSFNVSYGMGGRYIPKGHVDEWDESAEPTTEGRWFSSSEMC